MADNRRINGFTLIEMLIAMTLMGIMVVLLFSSLRIAALTWNAGEDKIIQVNKKAVVYQFFKRHLTTIHPVLMPSTLTNNGEDGALPQLAFQGMPKSLLFVAKLPASAVRKGLQVFDISADTNNASRLMVGLTPYLQAQPGQPEKVVLLEDVRAFAFAYFGKKDDANGLGWYDDWTQIDHLPQLIRVRIQLDDGSFWPDMLFPVKITGQLQSNPVPGGKPPSSP